MSRRLRLLLLAAVLLFNQQGGIVHLADHLALHLRDEPVPVQGGDCEQCVLYAALGAAPISVGPVVPATRCVPPEPEASLPASTPARLRLAYLSRAPPMPA